MTRVFVRIVAPVLLFSAFFVWLFSKLFLSSGFLAHSDLWEYFLPAFLSLDLIWSPYESAGTPVFADPSSTLFYPLRFLIHATLPPSSLSWSLYIIITFILIAVFSYFYFLKITDCAVCATGGALIFSLSHAVLAKIPHFTALGSFVWLPLILLAVEHLVERPRVEWICAGSLAVGFLALSGHTPHILYIFYLVGLYALIACLASRASIRSYLAVASIFIIGLLLSAIQIVPLTEELDRLARDQVSYHQFIHRALTLMKFVIFAFHPVTFMDDDYREAPVYVGVGALFLALIGISQIRSNWRIIFLTVAGLVAVFAASGDQTPIPRLIFELPFVDKTRIISRMLFIYAFALAALSSFGLRAVIRGEIGVRAVLALGLALLAVCAATLVFGLNHPQMFDWTTWQTQTQAYLRAMANTGQVQPLVWFQFLFIIFVMTFLAAYILGRLYRGSIVLIGLIVLVFALDLLINNAWFGITVRGIPFTLIPQQAMVENIHAAALREELEKTHQRGGGIGQHGKDPLAFGVMSRLWKFPHLGTYSPVMLKNYHELFSIGTGGDVPPKAVGYDHRGLDLAAARYIWVPHADIAKPESLVKSGVTISTTARGEMIGADACRETPATPFRRRIYLPDVIEAKGLIFIGAASCGAELPQGTEIGSLHIHGQDGQTFEQPLRLGIETADRSLGLDRVKARGGSQRPIKIFEEESEGDEGVVYSYESQIDWPTSIKADYIEFELRGSQVALLLDYVTLMDSLGHQTPVDPLRAALADPRKWRFVSSIETSRTTDRGADEAAQGETRLDIFENLRVLPRAWIVPAIEELDDKAITDAISGSQFSDGRPFDPAQVALLEKGTQKLRKLPPGGGHGTAEVLSLSPTEIRVQTRTDGPAYLALSDVWYPGWEAWLGDKRLFVYEADRALRLVAVPSGDHTLVFRFRPRSLLIGGSVSLVTLIAVVLALVIAILRRYRRRDANVPEPSVSTGPSWQGQA